MEGVIFWMTSHITYFTIASSISWDAGASIRVNTIIARSTILTRAWVTFIDIYRKRIQTLYQIFWYFSSRITRNSKISIIIGYLAGFLVITLWLIDDKTTYFTVVSWITKNTIASIWIDAVDASSSILTRAWSAFIYIYRKNLL